MADRLKSIVECKGALKIEFADGALEGSCAVEGCDKWIALQGVEITPYKDRVANTADGKAFHVELAFNVDEKEKPVLMTLAKKLLGRLSATKFTLVQFGKKDDQVYHMVSVDFAGGNDTFAYTRSREQRSDGKESSDYALSFDETATYSVIDDPSKGTAQSGNVMISYHFDYKEQ